MIIRPLPGKEKYQRKALEIWKHVRGRKKFCNLCLCFQRSIHYCHFFKMFENKIESKFRLLGGKTFDSVCRKAGYHENDLPINNQYRNKPALLKDMFTIREAELKVQVLIKRGKMQIRDNNTGKVRWCFPAEHQEAETEYQNKIRLNKVFPLPKKMYTVLQEAVKEKEEEDDGKYTSWEKAAKKKMKEAVKEKERKRRKNGEN